VRLTGNLFFERRRSEGCVDDGRLENQRATTLSEGRAARRPRRCSGYGHSTVITEPLCDAQARRRAAVGLRTVALGRRARSDISKALYRRRPDRWRAFPVKSITLARDRRFRPPACIPCRGIVSLYFCLIPEVEILRPKEHPSADVPPMTRVKPCL